MFWCLYTQTHINSFRSRYNSKAGSKFTILCWACFGASSNARHSHQTENKINCLIISSWVVVACAWGNVYVCCRQDATGDNLHREWSTGEASKSQAEATKHVFLSATGDGFLGKLIYGLFGCCIVAWLLELSLTWELFLFHWLKCVGLQGTLQEYLKMSKNCGATDKYQRGFTLLWYMLKRKG